MQAMELSIFLFPLKISLINELHTCWMNRRTVALVSGALLAGGTLAYMQSRHHKRSSRPNSSNDVSAPGINEDSLNQNGVDSKPIRAARRKKSGLRSLHVLAAILLKQIGPMGMRCLLSLVTTVVSIFCFLIFVF